MTFLALGTRAGIWSAFGQSDVPRPPSRLDMSHGPRILKVNDSEERFCVLKILTFQTLFSSSQGDRLH